MNKHQINAEKAKKEHFDKVQRSLNPKIGGARKLIKEEEDGSITTAYTMDYGDKVVLHNMEGPALINKEQKKKEYHLNGIEYDFDTWNEIMKGKEGLPWYKTAAGKGTSRH